MNRGRTIVLLAATALALAVAAFSCQSRQPTTIRLLFTAVVEGEALVLNEPLYANPGGEGTFSVRDFQMYLSNIQLVGTAGAYSVPDSYHLARFDNGSGTYEILIEEVPRDTYSRVILSIGLDETANESIGKIAAVGDLDPNGRMAWNWEVGYKFVLFEGSLLVDGERRPLVYHVGFSENRKILEFDLPEPSLLWSPEGLDFKVDLLRMFAGNQTVDMQALPTVKFDRADAALLANNCASMISLVPRH
ncbi:MAG TPA: MbnP family protein [Candidatus Polarisedimenticolia bacterium]|nr:MbnP family protein [Candidatus Polarisedimenticolia bacterium]